QRSNLEQAQIIKDDNAMPAIRFSAMVQAPDGRFLGAITAIIAISVLEDVFKSTMRAMAVSHGKSVRMEWQFIDRDGEVLVDSLLRQGGTGLNLKLMGLPSALLTASAAPGYIEEE